MKYKIISVDTIKNIIEFLDEVQFDAAKENTTEDMQKINFCTWAINELLNSNNVITIKDVRKSKDDPKKPKPKSRDDYIEETFMDWNLPDMDDKDFEKLVDNFDNFLRSWEKEYNKNNKKKKPKKTDGDDWKPRLEDVSQHCSLEEISDMLLDDPELTDAERFELYYEEHERVNKKKVKSYTLNQMLKGTKITRYEKPPKDEKK
jgi:hypothetical protein|tara:strand:+ start:134 stop:745 length:612 start_codon:yes stop_codon:yes gene_type:complete